MVMSKMPLTSLYASLESVFSLQVPPELTNTVRHHSDLYFALVGLFTNETTQCAVSVFSYRHHIQIFFPFRLYFLVRFFGFLIHQYTVLIPIC